MNLIADQAVSSPNDSPVAQLILVVDDNEFNRDLLRARMEREGHVVNEAEDGETALLMLREHNYDLVLLDVMMPILDGFETLRTIKQDQTLRQIPVIMVSAIDEMHTVVECITLGADDYITKPINPVLFKARVRSSLERKRLQDAERKRLAADLAQQSCQQT